MLEKIERVCDAAEKHGAEDIFFQVGAAPSFRVDGKVRELEVNPITDQEMEAFAHDCGYVLASGDADLSWESSTQMRYRVSFYSCIGRSCAVLRRLKKVTKSISELGLPKDRLQHWLSRESGLILITGASGSGKSTSLASCLNWIIKNSHKHIVTVEESVQYILDNGKSLVSQREIGADTESFVTGLRSALRQSPDVIVVGELSDHTTAQLVLQACEAGHLVISTLHTCNVAESLDRLMLLFPEDEREPARHLLSKQIIGVLSQKLVPALDESPYLLLEHLENTEPVSKWLQQGDINSISDFIKGAEAGGNKSFLSSGIAAYNANIISEEAARSACAEPNEFSHMKLGANHSNR